MKIGPYFHPSNVVIAPMAGVTDQPFRNLCRQHGAYWVVSEMLTADQRLWHTPKSRNRLRFTTEAEPRWVQIAGAEPKMLADAAKINEQSGAQIIDINMGCPAKKVCKKAAGSALMRDEFLVEKILNAVVQAVSIPVTLKIRLGWSKEEQNALAIATIAEQAGIQLLTIHGRTRQCRFSGAVDYDAIAEVAAAVEIPVVANGDIDSVEKAAEVISHTGVEAVMIGRAAQGQPWLAKHIDLFLRSGKLEKKPDLHEIKMMLNSHIVSLCDFYGEVMGPRIARKHVGWYFRGLVAGCIAPGFLKEFNSLDNSLAQIDAIEQGFLCSG